MLTETKRNAILHFLQDDTMQVFLVYEHDEFPEDCQFFIIATHKEIINKLDSHAGYPISRYYILEIEGEYFAFSNSLAINHIENEELQEIIKLTDLPIARCVIDDEEQKRIYKFIFNKNEM